jgi:hypothetical protein
MTFTDDLAARSRAGSAESLPPGEPVLPAHHGRAADRRRGCVIKLLPVVWAEWLTETPDVSRADAASRNGGEPMPGT